MRQSHPAILIVDDDKCVLSALRRDLITMYGDRYHVIAVDSPAEGLRTIDLLEARGQGPAVVIVDQRMPGMSGVEFLIQASIRVPDTRRVLFTACAKEDVDLEAHGHVDHLAGERLYCYLSKPWHPPQQRLYPAVEALLTEWEVRRDGGGGTDQRGIASCNVPVQGATESGSAVDSPGSHSPGNVPGDGETILPG
jgi:thioredoxin reductase (NADPH)